MGNWRNNERFNSLVRQRRRRRKRKYNSTDALSALKGSKYPYLSSKPFSGKVWGSHKDWD